MSEDKSDLDNHQQDGKPSGGKDDQVEKIAQLIELAQKRGLKINYRELTGFGLDIDTPEDLSDLMLDKGNTRSQKNLCQTRFWERIT